MNNPHYANVIAGLAQEIDGLTQRFVFDGYQALAAHLKAPLGSLCVLYIVLTGYGVLRGVINMPLKDLLNSAFRIGLVYLLAMNWGIFSQFVVTFFTKGVSETAAVMMQLLPAKLPQLSSASGVNGSLQSVFTEVIRTGSWVWDAATWRKPGPYFSSLMIYASGIAVVGLAFFELVVAKLMLAICLSTAPLFVLLTLFDRTKGFFDQWLGKLVGFALVIVFVSAVVGFCLHLLHWAVNPLFVAKAAPLHAADWIPIVICAALSLMAILEVVGVAKSIGGGCSTSTGSSMAGGFIGGAAGAGAAAKTMGKAGLSLAKTMNPGLAAASKANQAFRALQNKRQGGQ